MRWWTEAGVVIETSSGSLEALCVATLLWLALGAWRVAHGGLARGRGTALLLASAAGAWLGGAWLGPVLFDHAGYSSLAGGAVAMVSGLALSLGLRLPLARVADLLAPPALVALGVARLGCLLQGCEAGAPSTLPWAVRHVPGTRAFIAQQASGAIGPYARLTEPLHPIALYEALPVLLAALVLWRVRGRRAGAVAAVALLCYGAARVVLEALRMSPVELSGVPLVVVAAGVALAGAIWLGALSGRTARAAD